MMKEQRQTNRWFMIFLMVVAFLAMSWATADASHGATLKTDKTYYLTTEDIKVTTSGLTSTEKANGAWVGLYKYDDAVPSKEAIYWYTIDADGTVNLTDNYDGYGANRSDIWDELEGDDELPYGKYYVYYFSADSGYSSNEGGYATGKTIYVIEMKPDKKSYSCGEPIKVFTDYSWTAIKTAEWVGLFPRTGELSDSTRAYWYWMKAEGGTVNKRQTIDILSKKKGTGDVSPGTYRLVFFTEAGYDCDYLSVNISISHKFDQKNTTDSKFLVSEATCDNAAVYRYSCKCGAKGSETFTSGSKLGHDLTQQTVDAKFLKSAATCTSPAVYYKNCTRCDEKGTATFTSGSTIPHNMTREQADAGYLKSGATCTAPAVYYKSCTACGAKDTATFNYGTTAPHNMTREQADAQYLKDAATCTAQAVYYKSCTACGAKDTATFKHGTTAPHNMTREQADAQYKAADATCTAPAKYYKSCTACGAQDTTTFDFGTTMEHNDADALVLDQYLMSEATCFAPAVYYRSCSDCGHAATTTFEFGEPLQHVEVEVPGAEATCTEAGWTAGTKCDLCGEPIAPQQVIPAKGHTRQTTGADCTIEQNCTVCGMGIEPETAHTSSGPATCVVAETCTVCHKELNPRLDHEWSDPDCDTPSLCSNGCHGSKGSPLGHSWVEPTCTAAEYCSVCNAPGRDALEHDQDCQVMDSKYFKSEATCTTGAIYYKSCSGCGLKGTDTFIASDALNHDWTEASCKTPKTCDRCKKTEGAEKGCTPGAPATCTTPQTCTVCQSVLAHPGHVASGSAPTCDTAVTCTVCGTELSAATGMHAWKSATCTTAKTCSVCGTTSGKALEHAWVAASCTKAKYCARCKTEDGQRLGHTASKEATCTTPKTCDRCQIVLQGAKGHTGGTEATCSTPQTCIVCSLTLAPATGHVEVVVPGKTATCTAEGLTAGIECGNCHEILKAQSGIAKLNHEAAEKKVITPATKKADGKVGTYCTCGKELSTETVKKIQSVKLSIANKIYNGKKTTPGLTIKDSEGNVLKKNVDFLLTVPSGRTKVGVYTYKITYIGNYAGTATAKMTIKPAKAPLEKVTAAKKAITVKWERVKKEVTGYQIMLATNKSFTKGKKVVNVKGSKATSKKITKLQSKKTYYVKVRTYKTVNGTKIYSNWTAVKSVKVK